MSIFQEANSPQEKIRKKLTIRSPQPTDGVAIHNLIRNSAFVDNNSLYLYLLMASHHAHTSALAERNGETVGVITAYIPPQQSDTLFIWQVAVDPMMRRQGLARAMLKFIVQGEACRNIRYLETTVTAANGASRNLFKTFAENMDCPLSESVMFERNLHFRGLHDSENLLKIGPFVPQTSTAATMLAHDDGPAAKPQQQAHSHPQDSLFN
jgi:L-2,4-diaminobutyric acid acetyltransferase